MLKNLLSRIDLTLVFLIVLIGIKENYISTIAYEATSGKYAIIQYKFAQLNLALQKQRIFCEMLLREVKAF